MDKDKGGHNRDRSRSVSGSIATNENVSPNMFQGDSKGQTLLSPRFEESGLSS